MTSTLDMARMARIEAAAAEVDFGRGVRRLIAAAVYYPARMVGALVSGLAFAVAAAKVGYADGRGRPVTTQR